MKISVIIPTFNRKEILKIALLALNKQDFPLSDFEVIIIDDGSTDETNKLVEKMLPFLGYKTVLLKQSNRGPAKARNQGIKKAKGKLVLIINGNIHRDRIKNICFETAGIK